MRSERLHRVTEEPERIEAKLREHAPGRNRWWSRRAGRGDRGERALLVNRLAELWAEEAQLTRAPAPRQRAAAVPPSRELAGDVLER